MSRLWLRLFSLIIGNAWLSETHIQLSQTTQLIRLFYNEPQPSQRMTFDNRAKLHRVKVVHELVHVLFAGPEDDAGKGGLVDGVGEALRLQSEPAVFGIPRAALSNKRSVQKIA